MGVKHIETLFVRASYSSHSKSKSGLFVRHVQTRAICLWLLMALIQTVEAYTVKMWHMITYIDICNEHVWLVSVWEGHECITQTSGRLCALWNLIHPFAFNAYSIRIIMVSDLRMYREGGIPVCLKASRAPSLTELKDTHRKQFDKFLKDATWLKALMDYR